MCITPYLEVHVKVAIAWGVKDEEPLAVVLDKRRRSVEYHFRTLIATRLQMMCWAPRQPLTFRLVKVEIKRN